MCALDGTACRDKAGASSESPISHVTLSQTLDQSGLGAVPVAKASILLRRNRTSFEKRQAGISSCLFYLSLNSVYVAYVNKRSLVNTEQR